MIHLLDIEGTICPVSFVKEVLYPYFLSSYAAYLKDVQFPPEPERNLISRIVSQFPELAIESEAGVIKHIEGLVAKDIKDPVLKQLQGEVWRKGYMNGELKAPLYRDAIDFLNRADNVFIYSSGSVDAQKLLFCHVDVEGVCTDMNPRISGYYDINTSGLKTVPQSYTSICETIGCQPHQVTFYSDNIHEIKAAKDSGLNYTLVVRAGNAPIADEDKAGVPCIVSFDGC